MIIIDVNSLVFTINSDTLKTLKEVAPQYHLAIVIGANLNREVYLRDDKSPIITDLQNVWKQEGIIENADKIYFIYRESLYFNVPFEAEWVRLQISNIRNCGKSAELYLNKSYQIKDSEIAKEEYVNKINELLDKESE